MGKPLTIEATYHNGVVELKEKPVGINNSRALVILLDPEESSKQQAIDWQKVQKKKSSVDKWIGVLAGKDLGDWKAQKREHIEGKHR